MDAISPVVPAIFGIMMIWDYFLEFVGFRVVQTLRMEKERLCGVSFWGFLVKCEKYAGF